MTFQIHLSCVSFVASFSHSCFPFLYHTSLHCLISYFCCYVFPLYSILPPLCCLLSLCILFSHYFRYFFPPLDPPRAGSRYGHLLPPSSLIEHCDADPVQPQPQLLPCRVSSRALLCLNEADGQWVLGNYCSKGHTVVLKPFTLVFSFFFFLFCAYLSKMSWKVPWCIIWSNQVLRRVVNNKHFWLGSVFLEALTNGIHSRKHMVNVLLNADHLSCQCLQWIYL